jgi:hypothetical protein
MKILEENTGEMLHNTELGKDFLDLTPKSSGSKIKKKTPKNRQTVLHQTKKFCTAKNTTYRRDSLQNGRKYL